MRGDEIVTEICNVPKYDERDERGLISSQEESYNNEEKLPKKRPREELQNEDTDSEVQIVFLTTATKRARPVLP